MKSNSTRQLKVIVHCKHTMIQVIVFEIDCAIFYTNLHDLFCQFISWTKWVNSGKFMDNSWISCQVMAEMENFYNNLIIINLYCLPIIHCLILDGYFEFMFTLRTYFFSIRDEFALQALYNLTLKKVFWTFLITCKIVIL